MPSLPKKIPGVSDGRADRNEIVRFELSCPCGQTIDGERTEEYQRAVCASCGETFFVLPRNVYPDPEKTKRKTRRKLHSPEALSRAVTAGLSHTRKAVLGVSLGLVSRLVAAVRYFRRGFLSLFTPLRIVMLCLGAVVGITLYWMYWSHAVDRAELAWKESFAEGQAAFKQGDFLEAERSLQIACDALDILDREDTLARQTRQALKEATAANNLIPESLFEMVRLADEIYLAHGDSAWTDRMNRDFLGTWIVCQTRVTRTLSQEGEARFSVDYPLSTDDRPATLDANLDVFSRLNWTDREGRPNSSPAGFDRQSAIFAAQLASCVRESGVWVIRLNAGTAFFWKDYDNFCALGFRDEDPQMEEQTRKILSAQSQVLEVAP